MSSHRFGNYIGEAADSDEESEHGEARPPNFAFDEAFGEDEDDVDNQEQIMDVDGEFPTRLFDLPQDRTSDYE